MNRLKIMCQLITDNFNIPATYVSKEQNKIFDYSNNFSYNPLYLQSESMELNTAHFNLPFPFPRIRKNKFFELFVLFSVFKNTDFIGTIVLGPILSTPLSDEQILALIKDQHAYSHINQITNYYQKLSVYSTKNLINLSVLLYYFINDVVVSAEQIQSDFLQVQTISHHKDEVAPDYHDKLNPLHDRLFEKKIIKIVQSGDVESLGHNFIFKDEEEQVLYSKSSFLRSLKNHLITLAALTSRAAIEGGLQSEIAMRLCDDYILKIEEGQSREDLYRTIAELLEILTKQVREAKEKSYSTIVKQAIKFVYANLYQPFTHDEIATYIEVNPQYLSQIFKKESGQTLSSYIQSVKVEEAKYLLANAQVTISDVSSALNFSDQSYFTKIFKQHAHKTPQQFRDSLN